MRYAIEKVGELKPRTHFTAIDDEGAGYRAVVESNGNIFVYAKRAKRYGWRYSVKRFIAVHSAIELETPEEADAKWHKRVKRVVKCLEESKLWPDVLSVFKGLLKMSYSDKKEMHDIYWDAHHFYSDICNKQWKNEDADISKEKEAIEQIWSTWLDKYPFAFYRDKTDVLHIDTQYIWELSEAKLKSMYFGKHCNRRIKQEISDALTAKTAYHAAETVQYDISFDYVPEKAKAWYSEEFRGCGNGHYYLALNNSQALFCEDD